MGLNESSLAQLFAELIHIQSNSHQSNSLIYWWEFKSLRHNPTDTDLGVTPLE